MPFDFSNFRSDINRTMAGDVPLILRARLKGVIMKRQPEQQQEDQQEQQQPPTEESSDLLHPSRQQDHQLDSPIHKKMTAAKTNGLVRKSNVDETDEEEGHKVDIPAFGKGNSIFQPVNRTRKEENVGINQNSADAHTKYTREKRFSEEENEIRNKYKVEYNLYYE